MRPVQKMKPKQLRVIAPRSSQACSSAWWRRSRWRARPRRGGNGTRLEKAGWTCIAPLPVTDEQHCFAPKGFERLVSGGGEGGEGTRLRCQRSGVFRH